MRCRSRASHVTGASRAPDDDGFVLDRLLLRDRLLALALAAVDEEDDAGADVDEDREDGEGEGEAVVVRGAARVPGP